MQIQRSSYSLVSLDTTMTDWFWCYGLLNTFLGAVLGSSVLSQLGRWLAHPGRLLVGKALLASNQGSVSVGKPLAGNQRNVL